MVLGNKGVVSKGLETSWLNEAFSNFTVPVNVSWVLGMCLLTFWSQTCYSCIKDMHVLNKSSKNLFYQLVSAQLYESRYTLSTITLVPFYQIQLCALLFHCVFFIVCSRLDDTGHVTTVTASSSRTSWQ